VKRAARSIAALAIDRRVVVAHCLPQQTTSWLGEQLDGAGVGASLMLCAIDDAHDCPYAAASDLAVFLDAEMLVLVTPAPVVRDDDTARAIRSASASALVALETDADLEPPIDAATRFVTKTGRSAAIGAIDHLESIVAGEGGTLIRDDGAPPEFYGAETAAT
jgi:hypothetical protein